MSTLGLRCYRCGTEYDYIGTAPHPGRCPGCGSPCVPPAGDLTIRASSCWQSANGLSKISVRAVDEQGRPFVCEVAAQKCRGKVVTFSVEGMSAIPHIDNALSHLPSEIREEITAFGVTHLKTSSRLS